MYISAINSVSQPKYVNKTANVKSQNKLTFKSYMEEFERLYKAHPRITLYGQIQGYTAMLLQQLSYVSGIQEQKGASIATSVVKSMDRKLSELKKEHIYGSLITKNGESLLTSSGDRITCYPLVSDGRYIAIERSSDGDSLALEIGNQYSTDIREFYKDGGLKMVKHISGSGIGQTSSATYYDRNGEEKVFRSLINSIFGI